MCPGKNFELELASRLLIALINVHVRERYVNSGHAPTKKKIAQTTDYQVNGMLCSY